MGRAQQTLAKVAQQVRDAGGTAQTAVVDVTNTAAMRAHADEVAAASGSIDIAFSATSSDDLQGIPLLDMDFADFARPVSKVITTDLTIAPATARRVRARGCVILAMGGGKQFLSSAARTSRGPRLPGCAGSWQPSSRLAGSGSPGAVPGVTRSAGNAGRGAGDPLAGGTLLGRRPSYEEVASAAVFAASDWAATMTATEINLTGVPSSTEAPDADPG